MHAFSFRLGEFKSIFANFRKAAMAFLPVILWFVTERCFNGVDCFLLAIFRIMSQTVLMLEDKFSLLTLFCQDFFLDSLMILRALAGGI